MYKSKITLTLIICLFVTLLSGCGKERTIYIYPDPDENHITWETATPVSPDELKNDTFYVEHTDGEEKNYYPLCGMILENDQLFTTSEGCTYIPTLFLGQGDRLIFHSEDMLLDEMYLTHCEDLGYTLGVYDINSLTNKRCYLTKDSDHILNVCTDAEVLDEIEADDILIDRLGRVLPDDFETYEYASQPSAGKTFTLVTDNSSPEYHTLTFYDGSDIVDIINIDDYDYSKVDLTTGTLAGLDYKSLREDSVQKGLIKGLVKDAFYFFEAYSGTYYQTFELQANIRVFDKRESFVFYDYNTLKSTIFEILLPDYITDGYYCIGAGYEQPNMIRIIHGKEYSINDTFSNFIIPEGLNGVFSTDSTLNTLKIIRREDDTESPVSDIIERDGMSYFVYDKEKGSYISYLDVFDPVHIMPELGEIFTISAKYITPHEDETVVLPTFTPTPTSTPKPLPTEPPKVKGVTYVIITPTPAPTEPIENLIPSPSPAPAFIGYTLVEKAIEPFVNINIFYTCTPEEAGVTEEGITNPLIERILSADETYVKTTMVVDGYTHQLVEKTTDIKLNFNVFFNSDIVFDTEKNLTGYVICPYPTELATKVIVINPELYTVPEEVPTEEPITEPIDVITEIPPEPTPTPVPTEEPIPTATPTPIPTPTLIPVGDSTESAPLIIVVHDDEYRIGEIVTDNCDILKEAILQSASKSYIVDYRESGIKGFVAVHDLILELQNEGITFMEVTE